MSPVLAALLFHAPGVRLLAKRRLTPLAFRLNLLALAVTAALAVYAGFAHGLVWAVGVWALGHSLWSIGLALLIHRGAGLLHDEVRERHGSRAA